MNLGGAILGGLTGGLGGGWAGAGLGAASGSGLLGNLIGGITGGSNGAIGKMLPMLLAQQLGNSQKPSDAGDSSFTMPGQFHMPNQGMPQYGAGSPGYQNALAQALAQYQG